MVKSQPHQGAVAQLGERVVRNDEVTGSIPVSSKSSSKQSSVGNSSGTGSIPPSSKSTPSTRFPDNLPEGWRELLKREAEEPYFKKLIQFLKAEYQKKTPIYPRRDRIMRALQMVDYPKVRVVILGQDPYHGAGQAIGLCFAVPNELKPKPPSLMNIFKEIEADTGSKVNPGDSELTGWASQGVLLLNTVLTVRHSQAFSHRDKGWEVFTDKIIGLLSQREDPMVFILWGSAAHSKQNLIDTKKHFVLKAAHPSPLSAYKGFFGCKHFSQANQILQKLGKPAIDWSQVNLETQD